MEEDHKSSSRGKRRGRWEGGKWCGAERTLRKWQERKGVMGRGRGQGWEGRACEGALFWYPGPSRSA